VPARVRLFVCTIAIAVIAAIAIPAAATIVFASDRAFAGQTTQSAAPPTPAAAPAQTPAQPQAAAASASASPSERPKVRLVTTGGTIANRAGGRLTAQELLGSVPQIGDYAQVEPEEFSNVASGELTLDQWLKLSRRLNEIARTDAALAGLVVTSGTDTLEELAYFLHLTVRTDRPVVIVGAMRRPGVTGYEGQANLLDAVRVAADPQSRGKGALVVLNDEIWSAREVTKTDAQRLNTFQTRGYGLLGVVDTDRVVYYRDVVKRHTAKSEFDVEQVTALPRVDVLMTYQGAPGDLIRAAADQGARGLVIATAAGATSGTQFEGIRYAREKQVVVVRSTRTGGGRVMAAQRRTPASQTQTTPTTAATPATTATAASTQTPAASNGTAAVAQSLVAAEDLSPIKSRILLMLALTKTSDPDEVQRMFLEY
jgi:L-asparaginase